MRSLFFTFFILYAYLSLGQKQEYKLLVYGEDVGVLIAEHKQLNDNTDLYSVKSSGKVKIVFSISSKYYSYSKYKDNLLILSKSVLYKNHNLVDTVYVKKINDKYYKESSLKSNTSQILGNIKYSANMLYFIEPEGVKKVFSEKKGYFVDVEKVKPNEYILIDHKMNTKNKYFYKNGKLYKAELDGGIINFDLILK